MKFLRSTRVMSIFLAAAVFCGTTAMAANSVNEQNLPAKVMNESDAPVVVSSEITGTAMGLGSVDVLGVYVRENPTKDSEILTMVGQSDNVLVLSKEGDWYRVNCNGVTGFVSKDYMTVADSGDADPRDQKGWRRGCGVQGFRPASADRSQRESPRPGDQAH